MGAQLITSSLGHGDDGVASSSNCLVPSEGSALCAASRLADKVLHRRSVSHLVDMPRTCWRHGGFRDVLLMVSWQASFASDSWLAKPWWERGLLARPVQYRGPVLYYP